MKELKEYYRNIQKALPCSLSQKRKFMQDIQCAVTDYLQEHPEADMGAVTSHFGTPQQIANTYAEEMSPQELQKQLNAKKWLVGIVAAAAACVLLIWGISAGVALIRESNSADGYHVQDSIVTEE